MSYNVSKRITGEIMKSEYSERVKKIAIEILLFEVTNWRKDVDFKSKYEKLIDKELEEMKE